MWVRDWGSAEINISAFSHHYVEPWRYVNYCKVLYPDSIPLIGTNWSARFLQLALLTQARVMGSRLETWYWYWVNRKFKTTMDIWFQKVLKKWYKIWESWHVATLIYSRVTKLGASLIYFVVLHIWYKQKSYTITSFQLIIHNMLSCHNCI